MSLGTDQTRPGEAYWDGAAETYEQDFTGTLVGKLWREAVWRELDCAFKPRQRVLELNCGTGIDAVRLAEKGVSVFGCDISSRMVELARQRAERSQFRDLLSFEVLASEDIGTLQPDENFDGAFSNFSGLNCVQDLSVVGKSLGRVLKPGSTAILCFLGRLPIWEIAWFLGHGKPGKAFRARHSDTAVGTGVNVHYPTLKRIIAALAPDFRLRRWKGVGIAVPPSYMEGLASRFPNLTKALGRVDRTIETWPLLRSLGGCMLLEFERTK